MNLILILTKRLTEKQKEEIVKVLNLVKILMFCHKNIIVLNQQL